MYILFEMSSVDGGASIWNFDCMGYAKTEEIAMLWVSQNPDYRVYKYCPKYEVY